MRPSWPEHSGSTCYRSHIPKDLWVLSQNGEGVTFLFRVSSEINDPHESARLGRTQAKGSRDNGKAILAVKKIRCRPGANQKSRRDDDYGQSRNNDRYFQHIIITPVLPRAHPTASLTLASARRFRACDWSCNQRNYESRAPNHFYENQWPLRLRPAPDHA